MGRMPLYPPSDKLITNNYPPLSFYLVGAVGRLLGDNIIAGRFVSLLAVIAIAVAIGLMIQCLGGDGAAARVGAAYYVATMSRFFDGYVGMDDPQLLAHALMALACLSFLRAAKRMRGYTAPVLAMVVAGFFKHNIITMPLAALLWFAMRDWRPCVRCCGAAITAIVAGFAACSLAYE
jgi:4-amino-4-deoxy-L-arabinose transferase-like glycosyltransferase